MTDPNLITALEQISENIRFGSMCQALQMLGVIVVLVAISFRIK